MVRDMCTQIDFGEDDISKHSPQSKNHRVDSALKINTSEKGAVIKLRGDLSMNNGNSALGAHTS